MDGVFSNEEHVTPGDANQDNIHEEDSEEVVCKSQHHPEHDDSESFDESTPSVGDHCVPTETSNPTIEYTINTFCYQVCKLFHGS